MQKEQDESFGHQLLTCARLLDSLAQTEVNRQAKARLARPALMRLLPFLDTTGVRPTVLARQVDVSKQAIGVSLSWLVAQGFAEYVPDPTDQRARLVRLTKHGAAAFTHGLSVLSHFERRLAARLGARTMRRLREGVFAMRPVLEDWAAGEQGNR